MSTIKRCGSLLLALLLVVGLLGGCQSEPEEPVDGDSSSTTTSTTTSSTESTESGESTDMNTTTGTGKPTSNTQKTGGKTTTAKPTTTTKPSTTKATTTGTTRAGYVSKSDTSVEPVRSLSQILSSLSADQMKCDSYNLDKYITPYWEGNIVYNESLTFVVDQKTGEISAPLLYDAVKILSVKDAKLQKTYTEGVDYVYENGKIKLTANSSIFRFAYSDMYFSNEKSGWSWALKKGGYTLFQEGTYFHERQVAVTYLHSEPWAGYKPAYQGSLLPQTISKLKSGKEVTIVYLGDSITKGGNASGMFGMAPNMPIWTDMVTAALKKAYPKAKINTYSASENGATTSQALKNLKALCSNYDPDLVIIGFGMNDGSDSAIPPSKFQSNVKQIMETNDLLTGKSTDYLLISTTLPNQDVKLGTANTQQDQAAKLYELEKAGTATSGGVVVGDMTAVHQYMLKTKRFVDMTANNVNHPNDFLVRAYAQLVCTMLIE